MAEVHLLQTEASRIDLHSSVGIHPIVHDVQHQGPRSRDLERSLLLACPVHVWNVERMDCE